MFQGREILMLQYTKTPYTTVCFQPVVAVWEIFADMDVMIKCPTFN